MYRTNVLLPSVRVLVSKDKWKMDGCKQNVIIIFEKQFCFDHPIRSGLTLGLSISRDFPRTWKSRNSDMNRPKNKSGFYTAAISFTAVAVPFRKLIN